VITPEDGVERERARLLLGIVRVLLVGEQAESTHSLRPQLVLRKHAEHRTSQRLDRVLQDEVLERCCRQSTRPPRVPIVLLLLDFLACIHDLCRVGHDDVVAHILDR